MWVSTGVCRYDTYPVWDGIDIVVGVPTGFDSGCYGSSICVVCGVSHLSHVSGGGDI